MANRVVIVPSKASGDRQTLSTKITDAILKKGITEEQAKKALGKRREEVLRMAMGYWEGTVRTIANTLDNPGMPNFNTGGTVSKRVSVPVGQRPNGDTAVNTTIGSGNRAWSALHPAYAQGVWPYPGPPSTTYWHKTGGLAKDFRNKMPTDASFTALGKYGRTSLKVLPGTKTLAKMSMRIDYPGINDFAVDRLIRASFAAGKPLSFTVSDHRQFRSPAIGHLILAEGGFPKARPWVAKFAAEMGTVFQNDLREMGKKSGNKP